VSDEVSFLLTLLGHQLHRKPRYSQGTQLFLGLLTAVRAALRRARRVRSELDHRLKTSNVFTECT
jgi:hypothetical protein